MPLPCQWNKNTQDFIQQRGQREPALGENGLMEAPDTAWAVLGEYFGLERLKMFSLSVTKHFITGGGFGVTAALWRCISGRSRGQAGRGAVRNPKATN